MPAYMEEASIHSEAIVFPLFLNCCGYSSSVTRAPDFCFSHLSPTLGAVCVLSVCKKRKSHTHITSLILALSPKMYILFNPQSVQISDVALTSCAANS